MTLKPATHALTLLKRSVPSLAGQIACSVGLPGLFSGHHVAESVTMQAKRLVLETDLLRLKVSWNANHSTSSRMVLQAALITLLSFDEVQRNVV